MRRLLSCFDTYTPGAPATPSYPVGSTVTANRFFDGSHTYDGYCLTRNVSISCSANSTIFFH